MSDPLIYFFTDFGTQGPYLGQMEAAVLERAYPARVINLQADAPVSNPRAAAYLLAALQLKLPAGAIVVCVVDPGVGGERDALLLHAGGHTLIGPDNGLLAICAQRDPLAKLYEVPHNRSALSSSFHGRDLFAPMAARVWCREDIALQPRLQSSMVGADWPGTLKEVIYVDHYGNLMTGLAALQLHDTAEIRLGHHVLRYAHTFSAVARGNAFWYRNSCGLIELAVNQGRADMQLDADIGSKLCIV